MIDIEWLGDSLESVRGYGAQVRRAVGSELRLLQAGEKPVHGRPLKIAGRGVWALKINEKADQFRMICVAKLGNRIYILHAFQEKTRRTSQKDIDLARSGFKEI